MPSTEESAPPPAIPRIPWIDLLLVVAAAVLVYLNALPNGFTLDDRPIIVDNGTVHDLSNQVRIWLTPYWPGLVGLEAGLYRPLTIFAFAVQWALGGGDPLLFHGASVLLHAGCSALVYALLRLWVGRFPALAGAGVFAVHPVHVEAVANVVGQAELLAALFVLAAVLLHATRPPEGSVSLRRTGLIVACYGLAMLAKEHAVVLPALLVAVDVARGRARDVGAYLRGTAGTGVVLVSAAAVYLTLRWAVLGGLSGEAPANLAFLQDPRTRIPTALALWPEYLRLLVAPRTLSFTYDPGVLPPATGFGAASAAGLLVLGVVLALVASRRAWPAAGLGAAWFLIGVLPVSNLLLPIGTVLAERTLYLPSVALALWVGFAAGWLGRLRIRRPVLGGALVGVAGLWLAGLAGRTVVRNPVWASNETLVAAGLESHPGSFQVQWFRALEVWDRGDTVSTGRIFREALAIYDGDARFFTHYARFRYAAGDLAGADSLAARALAIQPTYGDALFLAGQVAIASGDPVEARRRIGDLRAQGLEGLASALTDSLSVNAPPGG